MSLCRKKLTPLQRRAAQRFGAVASLTVGVTGLTQFGHHLGSAGPAVTSLVTAAASLAALVPVVLAAWVVARYLRDEPDEFVRWIVVRGLLWATAVTLAGDAVLGALMTASGHPFPVGLLNADLFIITTAVSVRLQLRAYR